MMKIKCDFKVVFYFVLCTKIFTFQSFALELEPGTWNHLPIGANFSGLGYAYTEADIYSDPALLLKDVKAKRHTVVGKYIRTFELFHKSARVDLTQGYVDGEWEGLLDGVQTSVLRKGFSDSFLRFAINLYGAPPLSGKDFFTYRSKKNIETIIGMGLAIRLPTGDYMEDKLINIGQNRFVFRPQLGAIHNRGKWKLEVTGEIPFYADNDEFFNGNKLEQKPLYIIQSHLTYTFRPGLSVCGSIGYDYGGENIVNGVDKNDRRQDLAWAFSFNFPINRNIGVKIVYLSSKTQESVGSDSDTAIINLAFSW